MKLPPTRAIVLPSSVSSLGAGLIGAIADSGTGESTEKRGSPAAGSGQNPSAHSVSAARAVKCASASDNAAIDLIFAEVPPMSNSSLITFGVAAGKSNNEDRRKFIAWVVADADGVRL